MKGKVWTLEEIEEFFKERTEEKRKFDSQHMRLEYLEARRQQALRMPRDERGRFIESK